MIRRNDELALLYEKIKIQQSSISHGEIGYRDRLEDLRVLKLRSNALRRELHIQRAESTDLDVLRSEVTAACSHPHFAAANHECWWMAAQVYSLQRELLQDRTKVKALSEELENPNNSHRWRKLDGSDPGTYEMVQKIQALQKRLIAKTEEVVEKDLFIQVNTCPHTLHELMWAFTGPPPNLLAGERQALRGAQNQKESDL